MVTIMAGASWTAPAKRSGDGAFGRTIIARTDQPFDACESGVALRFPPQSKTPARIFVASDNAPASCSAALQNLAEIHTALHPWLTVSIRADELFLRCSRRPDQFEEALKHIVRAVRDGYNQSRFAENDFKFLRWLP